MLEKKLDTLKIYFENRHFAQPEIFSDYNSHMD